MKLHFEEMTTKEVINLIAAVERDGFRGEGFNPSNVITIEAMCVINERDEKSDDSMICRINYGCLKSRIVSINFNSNRRKAWGHIVCDGEDPKYFDHWINAYYKEGKVSETNLDEIEKWLNE